MIKSLSNLTKVLLDLQDLLTTSKRSSVFKYKYLFYEVKLILVGQTGQQILQNVPVSSGIKIEYRPMWMIQAAMRMSRGQNHGFLRSPGVSTMVETFQMSQTLASSSWSAAFQLPQ